MAGEMAIKYGTSREAIAKGLARLPPRRASDHERHGQRADLRRLSNGLAAVPNLLAIRFSAGEPDNRRDTAMPRTFVQFQFFFCENHVLKAGKCHFKHRSCV
jgi:hypothetical protein